jgi:hypothetical protein
MLIDRNIGTGSAWASRWKASAARVRAFARSTPRWRRNRRPVLRFDLVRRPRRGGWRLRLAMHTHVRIGLGGIRFESHRGIVVRQGDVLQRASEVRQVLVRQTTRTSRHRTWVRPESRPMPWRPRNETPGRRRRGPSARTTAVLFVPVRTPKALARTIAVERVRVDRFMFRAERLAARSRPGSNRAREQRISQPGPGLRSRRFRHALSSPAPWRFVTYHRVRTQSTERVARSTTLRSTVVRSHRVEVADSFGVSPAATATPAGIAAAVKRLDAASSTVSMEIVHRRRAVQTRAADTTAAFAPQPQPLAAGAPRRADPGPPSIERIEKTLRESMTVAVDRRVRHEIERTLRPGTALGRRLRERIQSEIYDDVVFERERLGGR